MSALQNLTDCLAFKPMSAEEAADRLALAVSLIRRPVGVGIWEGEVRGHQSGAVFSGPHVAVFQDEALVAPCGPQNDKESLATATVLALAIEFGPAINDALKGLARRDAQHQARAGTAEAACARLLRNYGELSCSQPHPHDDMGDVCLLRTRVAALEGVLAQIAGLDGGAASVSDAVALARSVLPQDGLKL